MEYKPKISEKNLVITDRDLLSPYGEKESDGKPRKEKNDNEKAKVIQRVKNEHDKISEP